MAEQRYTPGYVNVPGKGQRYRNASGEYFDNHFGSIFNSIGNAVRGVGDGYNSYYNSVADAAGTERRDGTVKKPAATAQPQQSPGGKGNRITMGGTTYNMSDPKQKAAYEKAQKAELERQRGKSKFADIRGGDGLKSSGNGRFAAPPTANPNGVEQTGTNTGFKGSGFAEANDLLARLGITTSRYGDFQSNDLPGVDNTGTKQGLSNDDFILQAQSGGYLDGFKGGSNDDAILYAQGKGFEPITQKQTEGSPKLTQSGVQSVTKPVETAPLGSVARYGQEFMADRPGMPADKSTSLVGLRAAEASKGLLYASGKYWKANPNAGQEGEKDFVEIQKDEWNTIKRGDQHAQDFLSEKIEQVKPVVSLDSEQDVYELPENQKPTSRIDATAQVNPQQITQAPTLTQAVDVRFTDKDPTGRYNNFNNR